MRCHLGVGFFFFFFGKMRHEKSGPHDKVAVKRQVFHINRVTDLNVARSPLLSESLITVIDWFDVYFNFDKISSQGFLITVQTCLSHSVSVDWLLPVPIKCLLILVWEQHIFLSNCWTATKTFVWTLKTLSERILSIWWSLVFPFHHQVF